MDDNDYLNKVKNQIEHDKLIHSVKQEYINKVEKLLNKKKEIIEKNGIFADIKLRIINKEINKLINNSKKS